VSVCVLGYVSTRKYRKLDRTGFVTDWCSESRCVSTNDRHGDRYRCHRYVSYRSFCTHGRRVTLPIL